MTRKRRKKSILTTPLIVIVIAFNLVGLIGFLVTPLRTTSATLVQWHLLLMAVTLAVSHKDFSARFVLFTLILYVLGLSVEWIGVHKSWLFGVYSYGNTLGHKVDGVPLSIGLSWFLVVYATGVAMRRSRIRNMLSRIAAGAAVLLFLDVLIEPVATKFDYWHWANGVIPFTNYVSWYFIGALMLFIFEKFNFKKQGIVAPIFLLTQFLYFFILNFV